MTDTIVTPVGHWDKWIWFWINFPQTISGLNKNHFQFIKFSIWFWKPCTCCGWHNWDGGGGVCVLYIPVRYISFCHVIHHATITNISHKDTSLATADHPVHRHNQPPPHHHSVIYIDSHLFTIMDNLDTQPNNEKCISEGFLHNLAMYIGREMKNPDVSILFHLAPIYSW